MRLESADLARIAALRRVSQAEGVLSVYLPIEPATALHHGYILRLMDVLRELRESSDEAAGERLDEESERLLTYLREEYTPHGLAFVAFASHPAGVWETFSFQVGVPALARFGPRPFLLPLDAVLEDYPPTAVVLADDEEARLFVLQLGELTAQRHLRSHVPGLQRQGGWSAFKYERDRARHVREHRKRVVAELAALVKEQPVESLVIGGSDEARAALIDLLPDGLRRRLAGDFRCEMFAIDADVLDRARAVLEAAKRARERELARGLVDLALGGGRAALGREETLQTLREGRARSLVISEGAYYSPLGEAAASLAWQSDATLEVVHGEAEEILAPYEGVGAALRY